MGGEGINGMKHPDVVDLVRAAALGLVPVKDMGNRMETRDILTCRACRRSIQCCSHCCYGVYS